MSQVNFYNRPVYSQFMPIPANNHNKGYQQAGYYTLPNYTNYPYPQNTNYERNTDNPVTTAGKAVFLQALVFCIDKISNFLSRKITSAEEFASADEVMNVAKEMVKKNNLDIEVGFVDEFNKHAFASRYGSPTEFDVVAKGKNAFFSSAHKLAVAPKSKPSLILHEIGHAINAKGKFTKLLQESRRYAVYAPTALLIANNLTKNPNSKKKSYIEKHAAALGFLAFLPTVIEEGLASYKGIKAAKSVLGKASKLSALKKNYAIALGTYLLSAFGLGIASKQTIDSRE